MPADRNRVAELVSRPSESLNVEVKSWLDPGDPSGMAKIAKAALALRNRDGGFLIIGFDDKTLAPLPNPLSKDLQTLFHTDVIQGIVSQYAQEPFEITVHFTERDGGEYPVLEVASGVRVPVAAKRDLFTQDKKKLIQEGDVYFRTLESNGKPSTAKARPRDWREMVEICFENREADIGRFLRRLTHRPGGQDLVALLHGLPVPPTLQQRAYELLDDGSKRAQNAFERLESAGHLAPPKDYGTWGVSLVFDRTGRKALPSRDFLNTVLSSNAQYTGWPIWLDSRGFSDHDAHPAVIDGAWQATIGSKGFTNHFDFLRLSPKGEFYLWRILQDDLVPDKVSPKTSLDPILVIIRIAEAFAVGVGIAKALSSRDQEVLGFGFEWTGLNKRRLNSWANPMASVGPSDAAHQNGVRSFIEVAVETPLLALAPFVKEATQELFALFGEEIPDRVYEDWTQRLVQRRLGHW